MSDVVVGILEDQPAEARMLVLWLQEAGYSVFHCDTGASLLARLDVEHVDILILDWQLPDCEGIDVLADLRQQQRFTGPVIFATAKDSEEDIVRGLSVGADDYLVKPLRKAELLARLAALWRRVSPDSQEALKLGPVELDLGSARAYLDGEEVKLTPTEFKLAACVIANVGKLLSREQLLKDVWGVEAQLDTRTVDMHISRLRKVLKIGPNMGYCIKTVYRHGYRLEAL